jgi:predicted aldo/keto reductase-like oxidoreductase
VFLCLKFGDPGNKDKSVANLDRALKVLNTDRADILMPTIHKADPSHVQRIASFTDAMVKAGKIRFKGFTCHGEMNQVMELVLKETPDTFDGALLSLTMAMPSTGDSKKKFSDEERTRFAANIKALREQKVGIISMKTGARNEVGRGPERFEPHVKTVIKGGADTVLTSIRSFAQLETIKKLDLSSLAMSWREKWLVAATCSGACLMCGRCSQACPHGLPVEDLVRVDSYPTGGGWPEHAADEFASLKVDATTTANACAACGICSRSCPSGLASGDKVRSIVNRFSSAIA